MKIITPCLLWIIVSTSLLIAEEVPLSSETIIVQPVVIEQEKAHPIDESYYIAILQTQIEQQGFMVNVLGASIGLLALAFALISVFQIYNFRLQNKKLKEMIQDAKGMAKRQYITLKQEELRGMLSMGDGLREPYSLKAVIHSSLHIKECHPTIIENFYKIAKNLANNVFIGIPDEYLSLKEAICINLLKHRSFQSIEIWSYIVSKKTVEAVTIDYIQYIKSNSTKELDSQALSMIINMVLRYGSDELLEELVKALLVAFSIDSIRNALSEGSSSIRIRQVPERIINIIDEYEK